MKTLKYIFFSAVLLGFTACDSDDDSSTDVEPLPELSAGTANFSTYVSLGNSLTAGFTDSALFIAGQENSFPNILSSKFAMLGGGAFTQPLMNDNLGGIALGGTQLPGASLGPRLIFNGAVPAPITSIIGPAVSSTDLLVNNPTGPFNNMGVPGAASFHLIASGYGNIGNLPAAANPYFVRMTGATPDATIMEMAMAQSPSFVTLWVGANDVLGYALGGASSGAPTPQPTFDFAMSQIMTSLGGVQGVMANIPNITDVPYFTTINHDGLEPSNPDFGPQIPTLNGIFGQLNLVYAFLESQGIPNATERAIVFSETENSSFVIKDESLIDLSAQIAGVLNASPTFPAFVESFGLPAAAAPLVANLLGVTYGQSRQANENDLIVLASSPILGTVNEASVAALMGQGLPLALAGQFSVEGITLPLEDKWIIIPSENDEINMAINGYNGTIQASASAAGFGFVDANSVYQQMASIGYTDGDFTLTGNLVMGGAVSLDGFHPTSRGYALVANEFMKAIDAAYGSNFEASGNLVDIGNYPTNYSPALQ
ncbi:G-D-S-L family lipolytic protein [Flavobacteriales bacterium 34_180_T64]|nr:G-D-S-L family lipolytic protein [Flavobacteriales bacterium 34_180_T64]